MRDAKSFKELLLMDISLADNIDKLLTDIAIAYLLPVFIISVLWEIFGGNDLTNTLKAFFVSAILLFSFTKLYKTSVDYSFDIAYEVIKVRGGKNSFLKSWSKLVRTASNKEIGFQSKFKRTIEIIRGGDDLVLSLLSIFVLAVFILLSAIYTLGYYLNYIFISISALIGILPISKGILIAPVKGMLWSMIVPIGCAAVVALMGSVVDINVNTNGKLGYNLKSYIELGVLSLSLFLVLPGVYSLLNGKSFGMVAASLANKTSSAMLTGGAVYAGSTISNYGKALSVSSANKIFKPFKDFSSIAKSSINQDASSLINKYSSNYKANNTSIPELFREVVAKDVNQGKSAISSTFNPVNHSKAVTVKIQQSKQNLKNGDVLSVYKNVKKQNGAIPAIKSSAIVGMDKVLNSKKEIKTINRISEVKNGPHKRNYRGSKH